MVEDLPECYLNTAKTCVNFPTGYCQHRGNLVACVIPSVAKPPIGATKDD